MPVAATLPPVLNPPYWNVNSSPGVGLRARSSVLNPPYWNVNDSISVFATSSLKVLNPPYWNVNPSEKTWICIQALGP